MRRSALLILIGVIVTAAPARAAEPVFGFPLRQAADCCAGDRLPAFSPDGSRIAFLRGDGTTFDLMVMWKDGTTQRAFT